MRSVLIYTVHKAASMFLHTLAAEVASELEIAHYSINYEKYYDEIRRSSWKRFIEDGAKKGCFGPIRSGVAEPVIPENIEPYSVIMHLRDPRDVLTSLFFSHTFSHARRLGRFNPSDEQRNRWEEEGIDKFVIGKTPEFKGRYQRLLSGLMGKKNVVLLKYEDMISDYGSWLDGLLSAFRHVALPRRRLLYVIRYGSHTFARIHETLYGKHKNDLMVSRENVLAHKRQILPGDHKRKLRPETIDWLDHELRGILQALDYADTG